MSDRPLDPVLIATGTKEDYNPVNVDHPVPVRLHATPYEASWHYASASGGITTKNPVTLAPAVPGKRNYITSLQLSNDSNTLTEAIVKAGSKVIWLDHLMGENGQVHVEMQMVYGTAIASGINEAITFECGTTGAKVYVNAQGYIGD